MSPSPPGPADADAALLTDLYQLTMAQAYWREQMDQRAVFSLFFRHLPPGRNYMLACGLENALEFLENLRFPVESIERLRALGRFPERFLEWLSRARFTGDARAVPEGTPVFPGEPLLEVEAPIAEAQLVESYLMNQVCLQTVLASKASRVVSAARGRTVIDFGLRRMHGSDAALAGARAFYVGGVHATSNILAASLHGLPVAGTLAHSYIQAHDSELEAFRAFTRTHPDTILLLDTYDTLAGIDNVIRLARELGPDFRVRGIRLDSGDLAGLARLARARLDAAGLARVEIFASGSLDEHAIAALIDAGAPITGFGVGTRMGTSEDAPALDLAYKLTEYAGRPRFKTSPAKATLPGRKQVFRQTGPDGLAARDLLALHDEQQPGHPLLRPVMRVGKRLAPSGAPPGTSPLECARAHAAHQLARLPARLLSLGPARPPYPVELSDALAAERDRLSRRGTR